MYSKTRAAESGYGNDGMPPEFKIPSASSMLFPPMKLARIGFRELRCFTNDLAISEGEVMPWGVTIASRPSVLGSAKANLVALKYVSADASPSTSIGFAWLQ